MDLIVSICRVRHVFDRNMSSISPCACCSKRAYRGLTHFNFPVCFDCWEDTMLVRLPEFDELDDDEVVHRIEMITNDDGVGNTSAA